MKLSVTRFWVVAVWAVSVNGAWAGPAKDVSDAPQAPTTPPARLSAKPNVVVILSDDMGYSDLGCYGGEIATPALDALAGRGLRFTQFYNTARCCPTRASLLTGLYSHQAGVGHMVNDYGKPGYRGDLNTSCRTMAEVLRGAGYRNYAVGKWHVTPHVGIEGPKHNWPLQRGFDRYYGTLSGAGSYFDPSSLVRDNTMISPLADPQYKPSVYYYTEAISEFAARFVADHAREHRGHPFFLYVAYTAPHWPMHALPEDVAKYRGRYDAGYEAVRQARYQRGLKLGVMDANQGVCPTAKSWESVPDKTWEAAGMEVYAAMVDRMDQGVAKIVEQLRQTQQLDNTLIFFVHDNGGCAEATGRTPTANHPNIERPSQPTLKAIPHDRVIARTTSAPLQTRDGYPVRSGNKVMPGDADTFMAYGLGWANVSNTPFREYKKWVHEGGIATPLIVHWPAGIAARGELRRQPGHLIDIAATVYEVAGATYPADAIPLAGRSLVGAFADKAIERDALYWEHQGNRAVRVGDWKLVAKHGGPWELYDLSRDRSESRDLADRQPEKVAEMAAKYRAWAQQVGVEPWPVARPKSAKAGRAAKGENAKAANP